MIALLTLMSGTVTYAGGGVSACSFLTFFPNSVARLTAIAGLLPESVDSPALRLLLEV